MSLLLFLMIVVTTMLAAFQVWRATQGLDAIKRIVRLETTPLRDIREGAVEVEGILEALAPLEPHMLAASGRDAVFADVEVKATRGGGRNSVVVHQSHTQRSVATAITTSDGTKVKLDFAHLEVVGDDGAFIVGGVPYLAEPTRAWATDVPATATSIQFKERVLQPGARVVVSGIARVTDATVEALPEGYRDGATVEKKTFVIGGTPEARMLVSQGSERQLLWRATWPVALLVLSAMAGLAYAGLLLAVLLAA